MTLMRTISLVLSFPPVISILWGGLSEEYLVHCDALMPLVSTEIWCGALHLMYPTENNTASRKNASLRFLTEDVALHSSRAWIALQNRDFEFGCSGYVLLGYFTISERVFNYEGPLKETLVFRTFVLLTYLQLVRYNAMFQEHWCILKELFQASSLRSV